MYGPLLWLPLAIHSASLKVTITSLIVVECSSGPSGPALGSHSHSESLTPSASRAPRPTRFAPPLYGRVGASLTVSHADADVAAGCGAAFDAGAARPGLVLAAAQRAQQQPQVEDDARPTGRHLHPEGGPAAVGEGGLQHRRLVAARGRQYSEQEVMTQSG